MVREVLSGARTKPIGDDVDSVINSLDEASYR